MLNRKIGHIILKGGTSEDIRKEVPDFPLNPTKEYFSELGYKDSTAKLYLSKLQNNSKKKETESSKNISIQQISEDSNKDISTIEATIIKSESADYNNLLVDTCALGYKDTINLIEQAEQVTFIKTIIEEMDRKKKHKKDSNAQQKFLAANIRLYINKILLDTEKFMLAPFSGLNDTKYPDNVLLQYLLILPKQIRPTLITADKNLAVKAKLHELPFILFDVAKETYGESEETHQEIQEEIPKEVTKKLGNGIYQINIADDIYIEYKGTQKVKIIHEDGTETVYKKERIKVKSGDKILNIVKNNGKTLEKYFELK